MQKKASDVDKNTFTFFEKNNKKEGFVQKLNKKRRMNNGKTKTSHNRW
jgi:hypothetical protein